MPDKGRIYLFHILRKDGTSLFLNPFGGPDKFVNGLERNEVEGRYGMEPRVEALTMFRNELYRQIEIGVKNWLSDARFVPKFLISAAIFVASGARWLGLLMAALSGRARGRRAGSAT